MTTNHGRAHNSGWRGLGESHIGRVRHSNQDAFAVLNEEAVWVVADGMGGRPGGDVASRLAIRAMTDTVTKTRPRDGLPERRECLRAALIAANQVIHEEAGRKPELAGMGTTVVAVTIATAPRPVAVIGHVGDSRAYCYRQGALIQLTRDHSFLEDAVAEGLMSLAEASAHPLRHVLTRALGTEPHVEPDIVTHVLEPRDLLLLCTDGLTKMLSDEVIATVVAGSPASLPSLCSRLIEEANHRGGEDNVTVIVVRNDLTKASQDVSFPSASP